MLHILKKNVERECKRRYESDLVGFAHDLSVVSGWYGALRCSRTGIQSSAPESPRPPPPSCSQAPAARVCVVLQGQCRATGNNSVNIEAKRPRMSVSRVKLDGYNAWVAYVEQLDAAGPPVYFYFSGSKLPTGESWCSDCVEAMVTRQPIGTYDEFKKFADELQEDSPKVAFFFYSNWCPSCVSTEPIVNAYLSELKENVIFAHVNVGDRDYWKDKNCPFRTDTRTRLLVIPTIIRWKGVQRLEGSQCNKRDLLQMLFTDEED